MLHMCGLVDIYEYVPTRFGANVRLLADLSIATHTTGLGLLRSGSSLQAASISMLEMLCLHCVAGPHSFISINESSATTHKYHDRVRHFGEVLIFWSESARSVSCAVSSERMHHACA